MKEISHPLLCTKKKQSLDLTNQSSYVNSMTDWLIIIYLKWLPQNNHKWWCGCFNWEPLNWEKITTIKEFHYSPLIFICAQCENILPNQETLLIRRISWSGKRDNHFFLENRAENISLCISHNHMLNLCSLILFSLGSL